MIVNVLYVSMATVFKFLFWPLSFSVFGFRGEVNILEHEKDRKFFLASALSNSSLFPTLPLPSFSGDKKFTLLSCISPRTFHASGRRGDSKFKFLSAFLNMSTTFGPDLRNVVAFVYLFCW